MRQLGKYLVTCGLAGCAFLLSALPVAAGEARNPATEPRLVKIEQVEVHFSVFGPVVLLKVQNKAIPIFVDAVVAESIQGALSGQKTPRPLSHDLMHTILDAFDGKVSQAIITLKGQTFYADLTVVVRDTVRVFDSRSSDAIALAIHFRAPILVSQDLVDSTGKELEKPEGVKL
jgi:uncharacterized protein